MLNTQKTIKLFIVSLCLVSIQAFAGTITTSVTEAIEVGAFEVGIGSTVNLKTSDSAISGKATFLGSTVYPDGSDSYQLYLNNKSNTVYYIAASHFSKINPKNQTVLDSYEQAGGTCSGYAINNFLHQTSLAQFPGTGELETILSTEEGRTNLLADAINEYYLTSSHRYSLRGILNKYGKRFGFSCQMLKTDSYEKAQKRILTQLALGLPVIVSYNIGPKMAQTPLKLSPYKDDNLKLDERLWIPRKVGERNSGGHTIVATGSFVYNDKNYLVMIDSDWSQPRIWDMDQFLNDEKTALSEIEFISCK